MRDLIRCVTADYFARTRGGRCGRTAIANATGATPCRLYDVNECYGAQRATGMTGYSGLHSAANTIRLPFGLRLQGARRARFGIYIDRPTDAGLRRADPTPVACAPATATGIRRLVGLHTATLAQEVIPKPNSDVYTTSITAPFRNRVRSRTVKWKRLAIHNTVLCRDLVGTMTYYFTATVNERSGSDSGSRTNFFLGKYPTQ